MNHIGFGQSSFALNSLGLGLSTPVASGSKLQADFTTGTYKASGAAKTFADLFTFTRAGKAWLMKDTELQEYADDVPRFDSGLLLEESRTNDFPSREINLVAPVGGTVGYSGQTPISEQLASKFTEDASNGQHGARWLIPKFEGRRSFSVHAKAVNGDYLHFGFATGVRARDSVNMETLEILPVNTRVSDLGLEKAVQVNNEWVRLSSESEVTLAMGITGQVFTSDSASSINYTCKGDSYYLWGCQNEEGEGATSYILPTDNTSTTRPADFLLNKITGTTVTGDWDSTLTLSIVNGQLVHSGYGKIRSLEIN